MAHEIKIPSVGESITSATIATWHKRDGEGVQVGDQLVTFDTDKVSQDLEAEVEGTLHITAQEGEEVDIGAVIATIEEGQVAESTGSNGGKEKEPTSEDEDEASAEDDEHVRATPVARKIAEEKGVDLADVEGSGAGGRITKADVLAASGEESEGGEKKPELSVVETTKPAASSAPAAADTTAPRTSRKKMTPLRRKIAASLVSAQQNAALLTTFNECDMSEVMALRKRIQDSFVAKHGLKLGFMSFFVKAVVEGLKAVPGINAQIDGEEIIQNHYYDIGVAVGTEKGLIVPVIRDCDQKSFAEIEQAIGDYAKKARDGKIQIDDLQGGVFTISNGGIYGSMLSTPILNPPQSGILGMHNILERPMAVNGEVVIRPMMYLALSYDHRIVDGKEAVTFLVRVKECIEDPTRLLVGA
ncbi:MAG: 2-oxoglutarate dehydrogenase complex dihydrolipoyllysine-residue succinyltransferase [Verrucomicrobiae bacterium]|nr:2-oxoglutarate dehydrogenase complex dihydrolipoyllysine-residue succinyltransferase [Verrucomicrobiae bacterium]